MFSLWMKAVIKYRATRIALAYSGVAIAVALIALIGVFSVVSASTMTDRAVSQIVVDWQVQPKQGADVAAIAATLKALPNLRDVQTVGYADVSGLQATTAGTVQTTSAAKVLGLDPAYQTTFPQQMRLLLGSLDGPILAQQTAANLHAGVGDTITIQAAGGPVPVQIAGIVELPNADALFQNVGAAPGSGPQAPPDNVVILPMTRWTALFGTDSTHTMTQFHAAFTHGALPRQPGAAYIAETGQVRNFEAAVAGGALVGDNLGARLDSVRGDAIYARVIFLFLGMPAAMLAILLTISLLSADRDSKGRSESLLRMRGLDRRTILRLIASEEAIGAVGAAIAGALAAWLLATVQFGSAALSPAALVWIGVAAIGGFVIALLCGLIPALRRAQEAVVGGRNYFTRGAVPLWQRLWLDLVCLAVAGVIFVNSASSNYQVVLAPEGVTATSVDYTAFLSPLLFWIGAVLLTIRMSAWWIDRSADGIASTLRRTGIADGTAPSVAASLSRQSRRLAGGIALVSLAFSFAFAVAIFNLTYNGQTRVDALLTNGADVTVTGTTSTPVEPIQTQVAALPNVAAAIPMQHRFAYVGNDLQDIYGIDPATIGQATSIVDAYFANRDAAATLKALATTPDGVLVSQETVNDFQLAVGDTINLRLQDATTHQYKAVPFKFVGVALEFPTAPKDSFLVANAAYIAQQSGATGHEVLLIRGTGDPQVLAKTVTDTLGPSSAYTVSDLTSAYHIISSSLTAVDLGRLTTFEIAFAILLLVAATGMLLFLGFAERRRVAQILTAIGASGSEVAGFLWAEALIILVPGAVIGAAIGVGAADMLVKLLSGIFDPPPDALSYPVAMLAVFVLIGIFATVAAVRVARRRLGQTVIG